MDWGSLVGSVILLGCGKAVSTCFPFARHARNVGATDFKQRVESGTRHSAAVKRTASSPTFRSNSAPRRRLISSWRSSCVS